MGDAITPFRIDVPEADIKDLRERLRRTRWPEPETVADWSQGTPVAYARELCRYWLEEYDWPSAQARLNRSLEQPVTFVDEVRAAFRQVR